MKRISLFLSIFVSIFISWSSLASATDPSTYGMTLLGQGEVRYLKLIKVYSASLYAAQPKLDRDTSRCLILEYDVSLKPQDMITAANTVLGKQYSDATISRFQSEIETLHKRYQQVKEGDRYSLCYRAESEETTLALNNQVLTSIPSADFAELYFGIWLSDQHPIDDQLQRNLLSGAAEGG